MTETLIVNGRTIIVKAWGELGDYYVYCDDDQSARVDWVGSDVDYGARVVADRTNERMGNKCREA